MFSISNEIMNTKESLFIPVLIPSVNTRGRSAPFLNVRIMMLISIE